MPPGAANAPQGTALGNVKRQLAKLQDTCARMLVAERRRNASLEKHIAKLQAKVTKLEARDEELRAELQARDERDAEHEKRSMSYSINGSGTSRSLVLALEDSDTRTTKRAEFWNVSRRTHSGL